MLRMNVLLLSDVLSQELSTNNYHIKPWDSDFKSIVSKISSFHAIVLDFSAMGEERIEQIHDNLEYLEEALTPELLDQEKLIVVVVCGSEKVAYRLIMPYDTTLSPMDSPKEIYREVYSYDFLRKIIPEYDKRIRFVDNGEYFETLSIKNIAIRQYLDIVDKYFLRFSYDPDSKECANIFPIIKIKKTTPHCVAFENRIGRGLLLVLPSYLKDKKDAAFSCLIKICKNYFKVAEGYDDLELSINIPREIRENYTEALLCFLNDLYNSSCVLCGRALEALFNLVGAEGKHLIDRIRYLYEIGIIAKKTKNFADQIRYLRNEGAHYNAEEVSLRKSDFQDMGHLMLKLQIAEDNLSQFIRGRLSAKTTELLTSYDHSKAASDNLTDSLINDLKVIIKATLYEEGRFEHVVFSEETKRLIQEQPENKDLQTLNVRLLSEAYPHALSVDANTSILEEDTEKMLLFFKQVLEELQPFEKTHEEIMLIKRKECIK